MTTRARAVPFDGVVSNERQHWPGSPPSYEEGVGGVDHENIYGTQPGLNAAIRGMQRILMQQQQQPPPPPPAPVASISGPTVLADGQSGTWTARVSGGVPPYQYQWSGMVSGTASSVSGSGNGMIYLDVWDSNGGSSSTSVDVVPDCGSPPCGNTSRRPTQPQALSPASKTPAKAPPNNPHRQ